MDKKTKAESVIHSLNKVFSLPEALNLLKPEWKALNESSGVPSTGFCYIASEVLFHAIGGKQEGLDVYFQKIPNGTHWWISFQDQIFDPTASQLPKNFVYSGRRGAFLTKKPSKRAETLAKIAKVDI